MMDAKPTCQGSRLDWRPFVDFVRSHQQFLVTTHIRPDGDGIGSQIALAEALRGHGKTVQLTIASDIPARYRFLNPNGAVERFKLPGDRFRNADAVIVLDTGTWNQLGDFGQFMRSLPVSKVVIDHHQTQDDLGAMRFVDTEAEATGRLVYEATVALGGPVPEKAAQALFVAVAMDTGWFRHSNTTAATFALMAELVGAGARPDLLYENLFEQNTLPRFKLMGLVLDRLQLSHGGRVGHSEIHGADYAATGAVPPDSEDLVNYTRSIVGVDVGLLFMEQPRGGVKVSFRSREPINVARIAEQFGGGGHRLAAGATVAGSLTEVKSRVLAAVVAALDSPK